MRTAPVDASAFAPVKIRIATHALKRALQAALDEMLTLVLLTGFAAVLFVEFS